MLDFAVNVINESRSDSITVSPVNGNGFGCCVPPMGQMNFFFKSNGNSDSITLALVRLSDDFDGPPEIADIQSNGGTFHFREQNARPSLLEITNFRSQSITRLIFGGDKQNTQNN